MKNWEDLERECQACQSCALCETRKNVVFGSGDRNAKVMFIGEGPGEQEDLQGLPFVGRAGRLLDDMLAAIGMNRSQVYIANMVKCRPPNNRDPLNFEQDACIDFLRGQVRLVNPSFIVCLGRVAAMRIIRFDFKITKEHGIFEKRGSIEYMATFHPAYILRDPRKKPDVFADMCALEDRLKSL